MKKRNPANPVFKSPPVNLTREDIDEILEALKSSCQKVDIEDEEYEYETLEEIEKVQGKVVKSRLMFRGSYPTIEIILKGHTAGPYVAVANVDEAFIPFNKIKGILERRKKKPLHLLFTPPATVILILLVLTPLFLNMLRPDMVPKLLAFVLFVGIITAILLLSKPINKGMFSTITLVMRHEQLSFWARNKDQIWLLVIGAIVGGILTLLFARLVSTK